MTKLRLLLLLVTVGLSPASLAQAPADTVPSLATGTAADAAERLQPGQYLWAPQVAPEGPLLIVVSLKTQRAIVYRNGIPIGISTVSTGKPGNETPTGVFVILQKHVEHYSNLYDNAPMPYMQRLTWGGIALHAGKLPGYPASHGCIRLPHEFARLLYGVTKRGMTVVITDEAVLPRVAPADALLSTAAKRTASTGNAVSWTPARAPAGPVSIVISSADRRAVILRDGMMIGTFPIGISGSIERTSVYLLEGVVDGQRHWVRIGLPGQEGAQPENLRGRIDLSEEHRRLIDPIVRIGTTVVVTGDSLQQGSTAAPVTVIESDEEVARP